MIDPTPYQFHRTEKKIAVMDTETDPFDGETIVAPFLVGFYHDEDWQYWWGETQEECINAYLAYIASIDEPLLIYAHNGGNFDFYFLMPGWNAGHAPFIIDGRVVQTYFGSHEHRDSYKILPVPLSGYKKTEIDYGKMHRALRDTHADEIIDYLHDDCRYLYDLVIEYHREFGDRITIGSTALPLLKSFHGFETLHASLDNQFRKYYFGGRVQCFEVGELHGKFQIYDVNSEYPAVMRDCRHPVGNHFTLSKRIGPSTQFACIEAVNMGALPSRADNGSLDFTVERGVFFATIHEINAGLETGTLKIIRVKHAWDCAETTTFDAFVNHFYAARMGARESGNKILDLFYKLILNSAYGKFAQDPSDYKQYYMTDGDWPDVDGEWDIASAQDGHYIWERPSPRNFSGFKNVATAASITGAARALLLRGISAAVRPIYCDTDSLVCEHFTGDVDPNKLGAWKHEGTIDQAAIAGKKLYALFLRGELIKKASKGGRLTGDEILTIARGGEVEYHNPVPKFSLDKEATFVTRTFRRTN